MVHHIEKYTIRGSSYGIEDREDGRHDADHFFPDDKTRKRFSCWVGGCGIGQFDTLEEARTKLIDHARFRAAGDKASAVRTVQECDHVLITLSPSANPLSVFVSE